MYLGYREWDSTRCNNIFVVCLEGTQQDIKRVELTSSYFNQPKFETWSYNQLIKQNITPVTKSGRVIQGSFLIGENFE